MSVVPTELPALEPVLEPQPQPPLHGLRLLPAPVSEPPYDDELPGGRPLPLRGSDLPARPSLRLVPSPPPVDAPALPPVRPFAAALVQRMLEALAGVRPVAQLKRDTTDDVYDDLERMVTVRPRVTGRRPDGRSLRSVHVQEQPDGIAEVFATVLRGERYGALAMRLEHTDGRWCCTAVEGA